MADHNDPNAVNSIFSDIDVSAADLYDMFGFPSDDAAGGEKVVVALTFASVPRGRRVRHRHAVPDPDRRPASGSARRPGDRSLGSLLNYFDAVKDKYLAAAAGRDPGHGSIGRQRAQIDFIGFPGGSFATVVDDEHSRRPSTRRTATRSRATSAAATTRSSTTCRASSARSTTRRSSTTSRSHDDRPARAADPEDAARAGRQSPVQLRPGESRRTGAA